MAVYFRAAKNETDETNFNNSRKIVIILKYG
jgi:hypothetical protein